MMAEEPFLQQLQQMLLPHFAPLFLVVFELSQHLHQGRGRRVPQAFLQGCRHGKYCHGSSLDPTPNLHPRPVQFMTDLVGSAP